MEKSFQTLSQDPWNKLKVYFCLRLIESEPKALKRADLMLDLAEMRRPVDLAFAFDLVEIAIKSAPTEAAILSRARSLLDKWAFSGESRKEGLAAVPSPISSQMPKGTSGETAAKDIGARAGDFTPALDSNKSESVNPGLRVNPAASVQQAAPVNPVASVQQAAPVNPVASVQQAAPVNPVASVQQVAPVQPVSPSDSAGSQGSYFSLAEQRRSLREVAQKEILRLGLTGYFRQIATSRGVANQALNGLEDVQATWLGIAQFLELLRFRKGVSPAQWNEVREEVEAVLMLIEPKGKALKKLRELDTN